MNDKIYDIIKDVALCWMPYGITFVGVIIATCNIPYGEAILAILAGANGFLGSVVKYYKSKYDKEDK